MVRKILGGLATVRPRFTRLYVELETLSNRSFATRMYKVKTTARTWLGTNL